MIEGLRGKASTENGVLTASGLMSYVYGKVANDKNSNQTPHYGYFDGDGDFILQAPQLTELEEPEDKDLDRLVVVPFSEEEILEETTPSKIRKIKSLLDSDASAIELHDFIIQEVRRFLSGTSEDSFKAQGQYSQDELFGRIAKYEEVSNDLALLIACIAYWARPTHRAILQKTLARSCYRIGLQAGLEVWVKLRWYPLILQLYCAGIAAVEGKRYDSLANIFFTTVRPSEYQEGDEFFVEAVAEGIQGLTSSKVFHQLPGYERYYTPMSEYLFKVLQPKLDDILFVGKSYERSFEEFEVFLALAVADLRQQRSERVWGPVGRFGWKHRTRSGAPLSRVVAEARAAGENWPPIKGGLFGGKLERFNAVADEFQRMVSGLNWW